ncbi:MAG: sulfite exporter TauE/SafE family protein, partial [Deltaproteobacteria bacterium]|nr:sulfite exporter TauE/SafE family protein [Deltaproteobacteria bacterium]
LAIVLLSSMAGLIGKATTGQIEWMMAVPIVLTVMPATRVGSLVSRRVPVLGLRRALAVLIAIAAIRIWVSVLFG